MRTAAVVLLLGALAVAAKDKPARQQGRGHGQPEARAAERAGGREDKRQERVEHRENKRIQRAYRREFADEDRPVVVRWYHEHYRGIRRGGLPPGLMKQLRRNGHLPPGLEKQFVVFPPVLVRMLPPVAPGYERGFIGHIAIIWNPRTRVVLDFFAVN